MVKTIGGLPLKQVLDMAPEWATHVSTHFTCPDTCIFESEEYFQAYDFKGGLHDRGKQLSGGMQPDAVLLSDFTGA